MGFVLQVIWQLKILFTIALFLDVTITSSGFSVPLPQKPSSLIPPVEAQAPSSIVVPGSPPNGSIVNPPVESPPTVKGLPPLTSPTESTATPPAHVVASAPQHPPPNLAPPPLVVSSNASGPAADTPAKKPYVSTPPVMEPLHDSTPPPITQPPLASSYLPLPEPPRPFIPTSPPLPEAQLTPPPTATPHASSPHSLVYSHAFFPPPSVSPPPVESLPFMPLSPAVAQRPHSSALPLAAKPPESLSSPPVVGSPLALNAPPPIQAQTILPSQPPALLAGSPRAFDIHSPPIPPNPSSPPPQQVPLPSPYLAPPPSMVLPHEPPPTSVASPPPVVEPPPPFVASSPPVAEAPPTSLASPPPVVEPPPPFVASSPPVAEPPPTALASPPLVVEPPPPFVASSPVAEPPPTFSPPVVELPPTFAPPVAEAPHGSSTQSPPMPPYAASSPPPSMVSPPSFTASPPSLAEPPHTSAMQSPPKPPLESSPRISPKLSSPTTFYTPPPLERPSPSEFAPPPIGLPHNSPPPSSTMPIGIPPRAISPPPFLTPPVTPLPHVMPTPASFVPPALVPSHALSAPPPSRQEHVSTIPPPASQRKETQGGPPPMPASPGLHTPLLATPPISNPIGTVAPHVAPSSPAIFSPHHRSFPIKSPREPKLDRHNGSASAPLSSIVHPPPSVGSHYSPRPLPTKGLNPYIAPSKHKPIMPSTSPPMLLILSPRSSSGGAQASAFSPSALIHKRHHLSPGPASDSVPPPATSQAERPYAAYAPKPSSAGRHKYYPPPPPNLGSPISAVPPRSPSGKSEISPVPSPVLSGQPGHSGIPVPSPKISPSGSPTRNTKRPPAPPIRALPPPPPNQDCAYLTCQEPYTNAPPGSPCGCVWPMQVGLRLSVALYTFFPLVSELALEIAAGVSMKQSQVRIMGATAATESPEKTLVLVDLVPLNVKFDFATANLTSQRFLHKKVAIDKALFGDYDVIYVRYPGLPPSPPTAPGDMSAINGMPYSVGDPNGSKVHPLGVDIAKQNRKHKLSSSRIAVIISSIVVGVLICCAAAWILIFRHTNCNSQAAQTPRTLPSFARSSGPMGNSTGSGPSSSLSFGSSLAPYTGSAKTFSATEIERATADFDPSQIIGEGGFGRVYSGTLEDETSVAVKVLKRDDQQGAREFLAEVEMLSRLHHRNLVKLIGICIEEKMRCLIYELIPNGSVESHLHGIDKDTTALDWASRLKVALGAARGLAYLHEDSSPRVIHRDFKSSNILLENDFTPKVSDFGLARTALDEENRHISTRVMGTFGYVAPEYAMTGHLLVKSDVYSYGVVLLELLTGRKPVDMTQPPGQENLVAWTRPLLTTKEGLESIIDPSLGSDVPFESVAKVAAIASMCVQPEVSHRPFMGEVVQALKLVCNECDDSKDGDSSHENLSMDLSANKVDLVSPLTRETPDPLQTRLSLHGYLPRPDIEKGLSVSEVFGMSTRSSGPDPDSFRRHSASGPIRTMRGSWFWQRIKRLSQGSVSEHGIMYQWENRPSY